MTTINLTLIRHGQTFLNTFHRFQGWVDSELTAQGQTQAIEAGRALANQKFDLVLSSDLHRAIQTRDLIIKQLNTAPQQVTIDPAFREIFFSTFEGMDAQPVLKQICHQFGYQSQDEVVEKRGFAEMRRLMRQADPRHEAELFEHIIARWQTGLRNIWQQLPDGGNVLVVSHGAMIRSVAEYYGINTIGNPPLNAHATTFKQTDPVNAKITGYNLLLQ